MPIESKLKTLKEAAALINDGNTISFNGVGLMACGSVICREIEKRFLSTGHPQGLTLYSCCGIGDESGEYAMSRYLAHEKLLKRVIIGHWESYKPLFKLLETNQIEAYNIPQGILSILLHEATARKSGYLSKVGLHTSIDPRYGGGALNDAATEKLVELIDLSGEEYLFYKTIFPDICIIQGTAADSRGNITFEDEIVPNDALAMAQATYNNKGKVIVLVSEVRKGFAQAQQVRIPGFLVDTVVINEDYCQCWPTLEKDDCFSGKTRYSGYVAEHIISENYRLVGDRSLTQRIIARRAAMELKDGDVVNLGIGIPMMVASEGKKMGTLNDTVTLTIETGAGGGYPLPNLFGVTLNSDIIHDQASQFRFYEGGGLDIGFLGALEVDGLGNVNVSRKGSKIAGVGGFNFIAYSAKTIVFCLNFQKGSSYDMDDEGRPVLVNGKFSKFSESVECISMNAADYYGMGKRILYVTERCVFERGKEGLLLTEIAPGVDLNKDILAHLPFTPNIAPDVKTMPDICFTK